MQEILTYKNFHIEFDTNRPAGQPGIVYCKYITQNNITLSLAQKTAESLSQIQTNTPYFLILDLNNVNYLSKEVRDYFISPNYIKYAKTLAIVGVTYNSQVIAQLIRYYGFPGIPTKIFKTKEEAIKWFEDISKMNLN